MGGVSALYFYFFHHLVVFPVQLVERREEIMVDILLQVQLGGLSSICRWLLNQRSVSFLLKRKK